MKSQRPLGDTTSFRRSVVRFLEEIRWEEELWRCLDAEIHVAIWSEVVVANSEAVHCWEELTEELWCGGTDGIVVDGWEVIDGQGGGNSCVAGEEFDRMITVHILNCIVILIILVVIRLFAV